MSKPKLERESTVRKPMNAHPKTVAAVLRRAMHCPGCVTARFITLEGTAPGDGMDASERITGLRAVVPHEQSGEQV